MDIKIVPPHVYAAALAYYTGPSQYVEEELLPAALEKGADLFPYTEEEDTLPTHAYACEAGAHPGRAISLVV